MQTFKLILSAELREITHAAATNAGLDIKFEEAEDHLIATVSLPDNGIIAMAAYKIGVQSFQYLKAYETYRIDMSTIYRLSGYADILITGIVSAHKKGVDKYIELYNCMQIDIYKRIHELHEQGYICVRLSLSSMDGLKLCEGTYMLADLIPDTKTACK